MAEETYTLDFTFSDETLNRYGYWVRTEGINTEHFLKNPVFLLQHESGKSAIGKITTIKKENGLLTGTVLFDQEDEDAIKIYNKYKNGFMSAVSIAFTNIVFTEAENYLKQGQRYATVYECELLEISAVSVPGNRNALKLFDDTGVELKLNFIAQNIMVEEKKNPDYKAIAEKLQNDLAAEKKLSAENLFDWHLKRGAVVEAERKLFVEAAIADYNGTKATLEAKKGAEEVQKFLKLPAAGAKIEDLSFEKMNETQRLEMRNTNLNEYQRLFLEYYGFNPILN